MVVKGDLIFTLCTELLFVLLNEPEFILLLIKLNKNKNHGYKKENVQEGIFRKLGNWTVFSQRKFYFTYWQRKEIYILEHASGLVDSFALHGYLMEEKL